MPVLLERYERVLYLDGDILVTPGAPDIFDECPRGDATYMFEESQLVERDQAIEVLTDLLGEVPGWPRIGSRRAYYNSGVMLFGRGGSFFDHLQQEEFLSALEVDLFADQTYFNVLIARHSLTIEPLAPPWNWMNLSGPRRARRSAYFIHYAGQGFQPPGAPFLGLLPGLPGSLCRQCGPRAWRRREAPGPWRAFSAWRPASPSTGSWRGSPGDHPDATEPAVDEEGQPFQRLPQGASRHQARPGPKHDLTTLPAVALQQAIVGRVAIQLPLLCQPVETLGDPGVAPTQQEIAGVGQAEGGGRHVGDDGAGLQVDVAPSGAHAERQVAVIVIGGQPLVQGADLAQEGGAREHGMVLRELGLEGLVPVEDLGQRSPLMARNVAQKAAPIREGLDAGLAAQAVDLGVMRLLLADDGAHQGRSGVVGAADQVVKPVLLEDHVVVDEGQIARVDFCEPQVAGLIRRTDSQAPAGR